MLRISDVFHQVSKTHGSIPREREFQPEWNTIFYKTYSRLPKLELEPFGIKADLFHSIQKRRSSMELGGQALDNRELSLLLRYSVGITEENSFKRASPSGGMRYPIETYILAKNSSRTLPAGLYHYGVKNHELHCLWAHDFSDSELRAFFIFPEAVRASAYLFLTAVFDRSFKKYGERSYRMALQESGHIAQNVCLIGDTLGLRTLPVGGTNDEAIESLLDVDGVNESVIYALAVGK